ncbi:tetratricopeptide repeat-containing sulfotransferase family protein [Roseibium suaedae]|uniref:Tetratricopeptide repeat-containing protein n=1 Tax=Roseibium suaedae TaxID=735517 RepID=A0A1M7HLD3_9HYPH|nr:tetratricopeptide repeat-containing sulfotransferase family protein [Roseibium suaedae]SHM29332.1 Tetratricopeptide repeat-containing protein [Roseibium suaedae]
MNQAVERIAADALALQHAGRIEEALSLFKEVLDQSPSHPQANFSLGIAAFQAGLTGQAIAHFQIAAAKAKKHPQVFQLLGLALLKHRDLKGAKDALKKAIALAPKVAELHAQLGDAYRQDRKPVMARQCFERALKLDPENGYALVGLGSLDVSIGEIESAKNWFSKAIAAGKELGAAHHGLALARRHTERPEELDQIEAILAAPGQEMPTDEAASLHWAAGKVYYDLGESERAREHYQLARNLHYKPFDAVAHEERIAFLKDVFTKEFFEERQDAGSSSKKPLFIFGMPRSGTTLVEQIFNRHSKVTAGGELSFFLEAQDALDLAGKPSAALEQRLRSMEDRDFRKLASRYLAVLDGINKRAERVTDKMPHNFEMLWLMALLFPKATFIHCEREPADTCMSLLSHALSPEHNYAHSQTSVGGYFRTYAGLMDHWKESLPVTIQPLSYEKLVSDQENVSRDLIASAGLDWEAACLEFYNSDTPVTTFSNAQVRRPMYQSSVGRWRRHSSFLGDLFCALGPLAPASMQGSNFAAPPSQQPDTADNDCTGSRKSAHATGGMT